jgi:hypothetical protein
MLTLTCIHVHVYGCLNTLIYLIVYLYDNLNKSLDYHIDYIVKC